MAFKTEKELSVDIKKFLENDGKCPKIFVTSPKWIGSIEIKVRDVRKHNLQVGYEPTKNNKYHGEIWGKIKKPSLIRELLNDSRWFVEIPNVKINK